MAQKWNLQDIRPAGAKKPVEPPQQGRKLHQDIAPRPAAEPEPPAFDDSDLESIDIVDGNGARRKRVVITAVVAMLIVAFGYFVNIMLRGADVTVHPKFRDVFVQAEFTAHTKPQAKQLAYELMTLEATGEKQVKASGKEKVSERAEGMIVVYNTQSSSQRLIKNTRFESPSGLIFRIKESIEVPGATKDAKGNAVPGSVIADVFADATGESYNIGPTRFTVPGLKGTEQYDKVFGESTISFAGGFDGERYIIDEAELMTAKQALQIELRNALLARLREERPAGFVLYDGAVTFVFDELPSTEYGDSLATIKERARLQVPIFKEADFAAYIADQSIPDYDNAPVLILDPDTLTFTYVSSTTTVTDIAAYESIDFMLTGDARIVWQFDERALENDLKGQKKTEAPKIFSKYGSIQNAEAEVRPFWESSFPKEEDDIHVRTVIGQ